MLGRFILKACMEGIEFYDTSNNFWYQVSNVRGASIDGVFCRGAGYSLISPNTILIYGGYDENEESRKECYALTANLNPQSPTDSLMEIQKISSNLPLA